MGMDNDILDSELSLRTNASKLFAWLTLAFGSLGFISMAILMNSMPTTIEVSETLKPNYIQNVSAVLIIASPVFGFVMAITSKRKREKAQVLWWLGIVLNALTFCFILLSLYVSMDSFM